MIIRQLVMKYRQRKKNLHGPKMGFILFMQKANKHSFDFGVKLLVSPEVHPHVSEAIHSWMNPAGDGDAGLVYSEPHDCTHTLSTVWDIYVISPFTNGGSRNKTQKKERASV